MPLRDLLFEISIRALNLSSSSSVRVGYSCSKPIMMCVTSLSSSSGLELVSDCVVSSSVMIASVFVAGVGAGPLVGMPRLVLF